MEFPYKFTSEISTNIKGPYLSCQLQIYAIYMLIKIKQQCKNYTFWDLQISQYFSKSNELHILIHNNVPIFIKNNNKIDFLILKSIFEFLIPAGKFYQFYKLQQSIADIPQLSITSNKNSNQKYLTRILYKQTCGPQLQIIRILNHRCISKPTKIYNDTLSDSLRLVYNFTTVIQLKSIVQKKRIFQQCDLRIFANKMLFLLHELESKRIQYYNIFQKILLFKNKLSHPTILDFSGAKIIISQVRFNYARILGQIMFNIIFFKQLDQNQMIKLNKFTNKKIMEYNQVLRIYSFNIFEFINDLIYKKYGEKILEYRKHKWLRSKVKHVQQKLETIQSLFIAEIQNKSEQQEQQEQQEFKNQGQEQYLDHETIQIKIKRYNLEYKHL